MTDFAWSHLEEGSYGLTDSMFKAEKLDAEWVFNDSAVETIYYHDHTLEAVTRNKINGSLERKILKEVTESEQPNL